MSLRITVDNPSDGRRSWLVSVDDATTVAQLAESLDSDSYSLAAVPEDSASAMTLAQAELLDGAVLPRGSHDNLEAGTIRFEVVGGPFAGDSVPIASGTPLVIGRGAEADIQIADPFLDPAHLRITVGAEAAGIAVAPGRPTPIAALLEPADGAVLVINGEEVTGPTAVVPADIIGAGSSLFRVGAAPASDADIAPDAPGRRGFNRPSRIYPNEPQPVVSLPGDQPDDSDKSPLPWLSAVIPVVLGVTMAVVFNRPIMLLMAAASPIMVVGSYMVNRRLAKRKGERTESQWVDDVKAAKRRVADLVRSQRLDAWYRLPDMVVIRDIATRPRARLWERRMRDSDALLARVGVTERGLDARLEGGSSKARSDPKQVGVSPAPIAADLSIGAVGIAGPSDAVRSTVRAMIAGLATLRSPRDFTVVVVCDELQDSAWSWTTWLPHARSGDSPVALIGNTDDTRRSRVRELGVLLETRMRAGVGSIDSHIVLVVDGARDYRTLPGMVPLLASGAEYGISVIALDSDRARLPEECSTVVVVDGSDPSMARLESEAGYYGTVLLDGLSIPVAEEIARSLCSIEHVSGVGDEGMLPTSVRFTELLGIDLDDSEGLVRRWSASPRRSLVVVGANADGEFAIDIAADGPHALVAGTTGSGKSEFLQTLVVSLALANRPDALNFVLVDYKGGSAFADCERLPHTVGMVTNLDARETERALASLDAELKRRERVLRQMGAKDVDGAWERDPDAAAASGLARLMIVIDEFAELKTELPEFINGIVRIARVGRSLGVNLVLATQRPSGVVSPEMQSNINLRIALRVTDRQDSSDVLGSPEAALISPSTPGRGFARSGPSSSPSPFQSARVAGVRIGAQRSNAKTPPKAPIEWDALGLPPRFPSRAGQQSVTDHDDTDLRALVNLVIAAAGSAGIARNPSPWLLPLPEVVSLDRFENEKLPEGSLVLGLQDVPKEQKQVTLTWNPQTESHLLFIGGARSGRTTALRTLLAQVVHQYSPGDMHLYVLDYGNGALLPLADAPHCGAVVTPLDQERLPRLMGRLLDELGRRQVVLSAAGVGSIGEQRQLATQETALPYAIVAIDGWERLTAGLNPDQLLVFREQLMRVLREGPAAGLRVLLTADRTFTGDKIAAAMDTKYLLPMRDPNDYRAAGVMIRDIPETLPPGRAMFGAAGDEAQLALLSSDTSGEAQTARFRVIIEFIRDYFDQFPQLSELPSPFRVDPLPSYIALRAAYQLPLLAGFDAAGPIIGVGGDELSRITVGWAGKPGLVIAGGRGSGRSSTLAAILHQLAHAGVPLLVVAPKPSLLTDVAASLGTPVFGDPETDAMTLTSAVEQLIAANPGRTPTVIVDDADALKQSPVEHGLTGIASMVALCVAVESEAASGLFGGAYVAAKKDRTGLVLAPTAPMLGTTIFANPIPKAMIGNRVAGAGVAHINGTWIPVRVPDVRQ